MRQNKRKEDQRREKREEKPENKWLKIKYEETKQDGFLCGSKEV